MNTTQDTAAHDEYSFMEAYDTTTQQIFDIDDYSALNECKTKEDVQTFECN